MAAVLLILGPQQDDCTSTTRSATTAKGSTSSETTKTCSPSRPDLSDVLPLIVLAGLFLLGEVSELAIPGVISLKTKVEQQEMRQQELERQLLEVRLTANQQQSVVQNFGSDSFQNPQAVSASARQKAQRDLQGHPTAMTSVPDSPDLAALKYQVLSAYERVHPAMVIGQSASRDRSMDEMHRLLPPGARAFISELTNSQVRQLADWYVEFRRELDAVRSVRNAVAHPPAFVTEADLNATLGTIDVLASDLERRGFPVLSTET